MDLRLRVKSTKEVLHSGRHLCAKMKLEDAKIIQRARRPETIDDSLGMKLWASVL